MNPDDKEDREDREDKEGPEIEDARGVIWKVLSEKDRFAPIALDHPGVGKTCPICGLAVQAGQAPTLVSTVPPQGASLEDEMKRLEGRPYNAVAQIAHESCAWAEEE